MRISYQSLSGHRVRLGDHTTITLPADQLERFNCPISYRLLERPVTIEDDSSKQLYSEAEIRRWLERADRFPTTGEEVPPMIKLTPDYEIFKLLFLSELIGGEWRLHLPHVSEGYLNHFVRAAYYNDPQRSGVMRAELRMTEIYPKNNSDPIVKKPIVSAYVVFGPDRHGYELDPTQLFIHELDEPIFRPARDPTDTPRPATADLPLIGIQTAEIGPRFLAELFLSTYATDLGTPTMSQYHHHHRAEEAPVIVTRLRDHPLCDTIRDHLPDRVTTGDLNPFAMGGVSSMFDDSKRQPMRVRTLTSAEQAVELLAEVDHHTRDGRVIVPLDGCFGLGLSGLSFNSFRRFEGGEHDFSYWSTTIIRAKYEKCTLVMKDDPAFKSSRLIDCDFTDVTFSATDDYFTCGSTAILCRFTRCRFLGPPNVVEPIKKMLQHVQNQNVLKQVTFG